MLRHTRSANALLMALLTITVLSGFAGIALEYTSTQSRFGRRSQEMNTAYAVADGASELLFHRWRATLRTNTNHNFNVSELVSSGITNISASDLGVPAAEPLTVSKVQLTHVDVYGRPQPDTLDIDDAVSNQPTDGTVPPGKPYYRGAVPGTLSFTGVNITYEAKVWVTSTLNQGSGSPITVGVKRYFTKSIAHGASAAMFFNDQLELHPGSDMSINGLVHTNSNLYACGYAGKSSLSFNEAVSYCGTTGLADAADHITNAATPSYNAGPPARVDRMSIGGVDPDSLQPDNSGAVDPATGLAKSVNYNDDSYRELIERPVQKAGVSGLDPTTTPYSDYYDDPDTIKAQRAYNQASIKVLLKYKLVGSKYVLDTAGTKVLGKTPDGMADGANITSLPWVQAMLASLNKTDATTAGSRTAINDRRENSDVQVTTVDVGQLKALMALNMTPLSATPFDTGVLYISDVTGAAADNSYMDKRNANFGNYDDSEKDAGGNLVKHAIMLTNGSQLPTASYDVTTPGNSDAAYFTVASDNPVYVKGDYNTGGTGALVPSNVQAQSSNPSTYAAGYTPVEAAILADTVTVVSNQFKAANSTAGLWDTAADGVTLLRGASNTTINTAVVCGYSQTVDSANISSGGAQNLIRLVENWSKDASAAGSAVNTNFTYNGSLMEAFLSKQFAGNWSTGTDGSYQNPNRRVDFDKSFTNHPPRGTPVTIVYARGKWERFTEALP